MVRNSTILPTIPITRGVKDKKKNHFQKESTLEGWLARDLAYSIIPTYPFFFLFFWRTFILPQNFVLEPV